MPSRDNASGDEGQALQHSLRHYGGFVLAGILALTTDALILQGLIHAGWHPLLARPLAIAVAMVVSWQVNRNVSYAMKTPPTLGEFGRFAAVSWSAQAVNYSVFSAILLLRPGTHPLLALLLASLVAMFVSYFGFRHGVFQRRDWIGSRGRGPGAPGRP
jgi:putative flippase GtrA